MNTPVELSELLTAIKWFIIGLICFAGYLYWLSER